MADHNANSDGAFLASARTLEEAYRWQRKLDQNGIRSQIVAQFITPALGKAGPTASPEIWVALANLDGARAILDGRPAGPRNAQPDTS
jgi:hypothetical protein